MKSRLHATVYGDVQGVFFRAGVQELGNSLGLTGWVRNTSDGNVELVAEGEKEKLQELLQYCNRGPSGAAVERVESEWLEFKGEFKNFSIKYSE
jgi:acylphosphatase